MAIENKIMNKDLTRTNQDSVKPFIAKFIQLIERFNIAIAVIAGVSLVSIVLLIVFNAIIRIFTTPIAGTVEIVGWLAAITAIFSLGYAQLYKAHVYIDLLVNKFPPLLNKSVHTLMNLISVIFFSVATWNLIKYGIGLYHQGVLSETMEISFYPIVILCSLGLLGLLLALIKETIIVWR